MIKRKTKAKPKKKQPAKKVISSYPAEWQQQLDDKEKKTDEMYFKFLEKVRDEQIVNRSPYELCVKSLLDQCGIEYEYQKIIMVESRKGYIVDFFLPTEQTVIEVDGKMHDVIKDGIRDKAIWQTHGYFVARVECCSVSKLNTSNLTGLIKKTKEWYDNTGNVGSEYVNEEGLMKLAELTFAPEIIWNGIKAGYVKCADGLVRPIIIHVSNQTLTNQSKYDLLELGQPAIKKSKKKAA